MDKVAPTEADRHRFTHQGRTVYEWDQTVEEVNVYIEVPPGITGKMLFCTVTSGHVEFGIKGNPAFMSHDLAGPVNADDSFWTLEDGTLHITLAKRERGSPWAAVCKGHEALDPMAADKDKKRLMLERFQAENPGFDFSGAEFNGDCPDPNKFMGGIRHE